MAAGWQSTVHQLQDLPDVHLGLNVPALAVWQQLRSLSAIPTAMLTVETQDSLQIYTFCRCQCFGTFTIL